MKTRIHTRGAFTLVELLTVIAIIGLLVGMIVPAVFFALKSVKQNTIVMEVNTLAVAVNKYNTKYGDFPPDGTDKTVVKRHLLKIFPQIASSELAILDTAAVTCVSRPTAGYMDQGEALVFFLGGFSKDSQYPITGVGGPIYIANSSGNQITSAAPVAQRATIQYNTERSEPLYDFKQSQLSLSQDSGLTISTDEAELFSAANDVLPVYRPSGKQAPYVYFDKRTYSVSTTAGIFFSHVTTNNNGVARPYKSANLNTRNASNPDKHLEYMNDKTFQIVSAGLDDSYGGIPFDPSTSTVPVLYQYPSGQSIDLSAGGPDYAGSYSLYQDASGLSTQGDNATNFADGILSNALDN